MAVNSNGNLKVTASKKSKCVNCGCEMIQSPSENWNTYCDKEECKKVFMADYLKSQRKTGF